VRCAATLGSSYALSRTQYTKILDPNILDFLYISPPLSPPPFLLAQLARRVVQAMRCHVHSILKYFSILKYLYPNILVFLYIFPPCPPPLFFAQLAMRGDQWFKLCAVTYTDKAGAGMPATHERVQAEVHAWVHGHRSLIYVLVY
jgi:hypothetical protein